MDLIAQVAHLVQEGEDDAAVQAAQEALATSCDLNALIGGLTKAMRQVGDRFERMEIFLPEMLLAARAMQAVMKLVEPEMARQAIKREAKGTVVIGTVAGDMHEIGKDIVITMLRAQGFAVHDLGANVNALDFIRKAEEVGADVIGASALMSTTMPAQREIIELLQAKGLREKYHVILGGAPVTRQWVEQAGADSWGENAAQAVSLLERVIAERRRAHAAL
jgi:corrinoid protein of di/trimethylamine methyltransferase